MMGWVEARDVAWVVGILAADSAVEKRVVAGRPAPFISIRIHPEAGAFLVQLVDAPVEIDLACQDP